MNRNAAVRSAALAVVLAGRPSLQAALRPHAAGGAPRVVALEVITENAATGDGGNAWGGHQCRIVRTRDGVFTAFTVPGKDQMNRQWRLVHRREGTWEIMAKGSSGREPVNLVAAHDGTLHVIAWPEGRPFLWSGRPKQGVLAMQKTAIPGVPTGNWPYGSAAIDSRGNLFVLASEGGKPGAFRWACRDHSSGTWTAFRTKLDYRHCYAYVIPDPTGGLSVVATRDVRWETLGYRRPEGASAYTFDAFAFWRTPTVNVRPLERLATVAEMPTKEQPYVFCNAQNDAYLDTKGRMHILYRRRGPSTEGRDERRHAVFSTRGALVADLPLPSRAGAFCRLFQDDREQFYLLGSSGALYPAGEDGLRLGRPRMLDLGEHEVEYSGFGLAVPRTGTSPSGVVDAVFPSGQGSTWIYCRIALREDEQRGRQPETPSGVRERRR